MYPPKDVNGNPIRSPQQGSPPILGDFDSSVMTAVKTGQMTEYTRYPTCIGLSPGCPCPEVNASLYTPPLAIPGPITGITFTVGSIIVSWNPPSEGTGPFTYQVTPFLNGIALPAITTTNTSYKFTDLQEWQPYTFTVCAMNGAGAGPIVPSASYFIAPPASLSSVMSGSSVPVVIDPALKYIINDGLDNMLKYIAATGLGPTRGSRYIYNWITSVVGAWNWVRSEVRISGTHDNWNWDTKVPLSDNDSLIWLCAAIDYITPMFIPSGYKSIYNCPADIVSRVKTAGQWQGWATAWETWYNYRKEDGSATAATAQPTDSANWNRTIIVADGSFNNIWMFPKPKQWTRLTVQNKKQNYLTYYWDNVLSSCLTEADENTIQSTVQPVTGTDRDAEIDIVKGYAANLTDEEKIIAEFWAGGPGTVSPPLMFIWLWKEYIRSLPNITCPDIMFSLQDLAIHLFEGARNLETEVRPYGSPPNPGNSSQIFW
jgi:hypothetical protein